MDLASIINFLSNEDTPWLAAGSSFGAKTLDNATLGRLAGFTAHLAMLLASLIRHYSNPILSNLGFGDDPRKTLAFTFAILRWMILTAGVTAAACVYFMGKRETAAPAIADATADADTAETGRGVIVRLIAISTLFCLLNSIMGARLFPLVSGVSDAYEYWPLVVSVAVIPLCLLAGRSVYRFNRVFLPYKALILAPDSGSAS